MTDTRNPFENHIDELKYTTINSLFDQKEKYLIIALTGKLGAGCSTLAGIFRKTLEEMNLSHGQPGIEGFQNDKEREVRLLQRYYSWHQKQFHVIKVRDVITSFLLEEHVWEALEQNDFYKIREIKEARLEIENRIRREHPEHTWENSLSKYVKYICGSQVDKNLREQCYEFITIYLPAMGEQIHTILKDQYTEIFQKFGNQLRFFGQIMVDAASIDKLIAEKYQYAGVRIACINGAGVQGEDYFELEKNIETIYTIAKRINRFIKYLRHPKNTDSKWPVAIVIDSCLLYTSRCV